MIKDELIEKNVAERLWTLFEELLQTVINAITESGALDIKEFQNSVEYLYIVSKINNGQKIKLYIEAKGETSSRGENNFQKKP